VVRERPVHHGARDGQRVLPLREADGAPEDALVLARVGRRRMLEVNGPEPPRRPEREGAEPDQHDRQELDFVARDRQVALDAAEPQDGVVAALVERHHAPVRQDALVGEYAPQPLEKRPAAHQHVDEEVVRADRRARGGAEPEQGVVRPPRRLAPEAAGLVAREARLRVHELRVGEAARLAGGPRVEPHRLQPEEDHARPGTRDREVAPHAPGRHATTRGRPTCKGNGGAGGASGQRLWRPGPG
jgi:hypothetical protein